MLVKMSINGKHNYYTEKKDSLVFFFILSYIVTHMVLIDIKNTLLFLYLFRERKYMYIKIINGCFIVFVCLSA